MLLSSSYLSYSQILWWCNFREALLTLCLHIFQPGNRRDLKEDTRQFYAEIDLEVKTLFIWRLIVFLLFYTFNVFPWTKTYILFFSIFGLWHEARSYGWFFSGCWNVNHQQKSFKGLPKFSFFLYDFLGHLQRFINKGQNYWALIGWERGHFFLNRGHF